ncbi:TonB-dependent receptor domain-containing protein [Riemerella columbina]|uniref:TonB-dependent receptor domain-containing protein n=1 Tax=Riemerella columbina TaxID=103810 RepID=UPI00267003F8|nr:TonB-dependent receptor [Riemerella columbina]WKS95396.1 TonB-dependent receptor family protein [Riemerella columbina]
MKNLTILFLSIIVFFINPNAFAQQYQLKGKVVGSTSNAPVEWVNVVLVKNDSIFSGTTTDSLGGFLITAPKGIYTLKLEYFGEVAINKELNILSNVDLGILKIKESVQLQEIVIDVKKPLIQRKVDRLVFKVGNSISATGGDAIDALKVTPSLRVQNDQISIIGKSGVSVMIDDKLVQLSGDDLFSFLKTIKSDDIESIEVITTPPAKYEVEGNSGIVNIKLKETKQNYISGNLNTSYTQATYPLGNLGGGLNYQKDRLTVSSNLNYQNGSIAPYQEYTIFYPNYIWNEQSKKRVFINSLSGRIALDYKISPKTTMGIQYMGMLSKPISKGTNTSYITKNNALDSIIITPSRLEIQRKTHSLNFHSTTKVDTIGTQYSIDIDYFKYKSDIDNNFSTNTYFPNNTPVPNRYASAKNLSLQNIDIYTAKFDYEMPLNWINLSFGAKVAFINNNSQVSYIDKTTNNPVLDPSKSNSFDYKENTQALYISGSKKLSERWDSQLGLRLENTQTEGYSKTLNQTNKNNYLKLFPTFYLTYKVSESSTLGLNYSRRINRPSYSNLNPFRFYSSKYNYNEGNPFLQPFYIDNAEISFTYKNYFASLYANYMTNGVDQVTFVSKDHPIQKVIPYNFYNHLNIGTTQHYTFNKWSWMESNNSATIYYSKTTSDLPNTLPKIDRWVLYFNSNNSFILNKEKTLRAELGFSYLSPSVAGSYTTTAWYYIDAGLKYSMLNKQLQIAINATDIFRTNKTTFTQIVNGIEQKSYDYGDTQKVRLSIIWNFGKSLQKQQNIQSNEEERSRL